MAFVAGCALAPNDTPVCRGVREAAAIQRAGEASRTVEYYPVDDPEGIMAVGCRHDGDPAMQSLCGVILQNTSREFFNVFAYDVVDCVRAHGEVAQLETGSTPSGLVRNPNSLVRMEGRLGATRLVLRRRENGSGFALTFASPN